MRVAVRQRGGAFGVDTTVEVVDGKVRVIDKGVAGPEADLDADTDRAVRELAGRVSGAEVKAVEGVVYDAMVTDVEIGDDDASQSSISVRSGDEAPDEVWQLVRLVKDASRRAIDKR